MKYLGGVRISRFLAGIFPPLSLFFILLFFLALTVSTAKAEENFSVLEFSPQGLVTEPSNIRIDFSAPVITSADIGTSPARNAMPVVFSPNIEGQGVWISRSSFIYQLRDGYLPEASEFTATIPDGVKDADGTSISGNKTFKFNTAPLEFLDIRQIDYRMDREVLYELSFNAPVSANHLRGFISVTDNKGDSINFAPDNAASSHNVLLRVIPGDGSPVTVDIGAGLTSTKGPLAMKNPVHITVPRDLSLKITGARATNYYYYGTQMGIAINTTTQIDSTKAQSFIEITPKYDFSVSSFDSQFFIAGDFPPRELITVRLKSGLPAIYGEGLAEDWERSFIFPDYNPSIEFAATGRFISPANEELLIPFTSVNIRKLNISVGRVYDNNVSFVTRQEWPYYLRNETELIYENDFEISSEPNKSFDFSFDLGKILDGRTGLFAIQAASAEYWPSTLRVINVTDIAGSAKIGPDSALIWANSISEGKPLESVSVDIYTLSNQLIASGVTDEHGVVSIKRDSDWDGNLQPNTVILQKDSDVSVLRLDGNIWQTGNVEFIGAPYNHNSYVGFVYTSRGIFRPGETAPLRILVRNADLSSETPFPVQVKVYNSMGREWSASTVTTSKFGMASADVQLGDGPTGTWRADVIIPGETIPIARTTFLVEDFAPPKIEVAVSSDQTELHNNDSPTLDISAQYLFGAVGSDLAYEVETTLIPREYSHPDWPDYSFFSNYRIESAASNNIEASGNLSRDGNAIVTLPNITHSAKSMLDAVFTVGVREDGGRWVYKNLSVPYYPKNMMLGINFSPANLSTNTMIPFAFAAIDTNGRPLNPERVTLSVARQITRNIMTATGSNRRSELRTETIPLEGFDKKPISFEDGKTSVGLSFRNRGSYIVSLEDDTSEVYAAARFFVYDSGWGYGGVDDATLPESLSIKLDKDIYKAGDKARATVSGSFEGTVLFSVETNKVLYYDTSVNKGNTAEFTFDVTQEMTPNAWITAHLVRAAAPEDSWSAHRAFGAVPLFIDCGDLKLDVDVASPEKIIPSEINNFIVRLTDSTGKETPGEFSIMLVDEGVLGLTNFRTPDFYDNYTKKRALSLNAYDVYTELMPLYLNTPPVLTAGGGDDNIMNEALRASMAPVRADRFKILAAVTDVKTNENGVADVAIDVPEFSGRARLMTIAASDRAFGASEKSFTIARDIVADITLPRALAPGDVFGSQIQLFNRTDNPIDTDVILNIQGPVSLVFAADEQLPVNFGAAKFYTKSLTIPPNEESFSIPLIFQADDESGVSTVTLIAQYGDTVLSQDIELAVRPPYPRITTTGAIAINPKETVEFSLPSDWFPGTRRALISMSGLPSISLADVTNFLLDYPYYCTEQITSRGWTLLFAPEIASRIDQRLSTRDQTSQELSTILRRIQSMQLYNGSFSPWETHPSSEWLSVYVTHFLVVCENEGIDVPRETFRNALDYLRFLMAETPDSFDNASYGAALAVRAYISYVLSLRGESPLSWMSYLRNNLSSIPDYGRLLLAAAYAHEDKNIAASILGDESPSLFSFDNKERPNLDSPLRTQAIRLLARNEIDSASPAAVAAATNLLNSMRETGYYTTHEAGWSLLALCGFFSHHTSEGNAALLLVSENGDIISETTGDNISNQLISEEISTFEVNNSGSTTGYVNRTVSGVPTKPPTPLNSGMSVSVRYFNSEGFEISHDSVLNNGERITAQITIRPFGDTLKNLIVALPLAGGLEIENPKLSQETFSSLDNYGHYTDRSSTYVTTRTESRDDRFLLFVDNVENVFSWSLTLRAITPGTFILPPIASEGMYSPGIRSIGTTSRIVIK